LKNTVEH